MGKRLWGDQRDIILSESASLCFRLIPRATTFASSWSLETPTKLDLSELHFPSSCDSTKRLNVSLTYSCRSKGLASLGVNENNEAPWCEEHAMARAGSKVGRSLIRRLSMSVHVQAAMRPFIMAHSAI